MGKGKEKISDRHTAVGDNASTGLARTFAILDLVARQPCRVIDITRILGLPWATVHRTIKKLETAQFIVKDKKTNRYKVGARLWYVGSSYLVNNKALSYSLQFLANADDIKSADVQIVERIGNYSVVIHAEKRQDQVIDKTQYGYHIPLHAGSKGLVLLAFSKPEFINNKYGIWLIGYDGMIKDYSSDDKIFLKLFDLIDSMPMRKSEIINDKC